MSTARAPVPAHGGAPARPIPPDIKAPVLLIHGRNDRMVPFEVSIAILNHMPTYRIKLNRVLFRHKSGQRTN